MPDEISYELAPCPVCGSPKATEIANSEEVRRQMEALWQFHLRRVHAGTPPEVLADRTVFSQHPALRIAACASCGTLYRNPREKGDEVKAVYAEEEPDPVVLANLFERQSISYRRQARRVVEAMGSSGTGLEVGSYTGAFLKAARETGWDFEGLDINEAAGRFARSAGFRVHQGTIEDFAASRAYDAVAFWNCFDQLPDPIGAARAARALLRPGGLIAIRVPNGGFYSRWSRRLRGRAAPLARAMLAHNNLLGFPYRHGFTTQSLASLLWGTGFEPITMIGDTLVPVADEWTKEWAALEEKVLKASIRGLADWVEPPWLEMYAVAA